MATKLEKKLNSQVRRYSAVFRYYQQLADTLRAVLEQAAGIHAPLAIVQARPKSVDSFAEKVQRKQDRYANPVMDFTDLAGARVITHTQSQVRAVSEFIESHFDIDWDNSIDISQRHRPTEFGYRSVHYIVQFRPDVFPTNELAVRIPAAVLPKTSRPMKAEIQVRTLLEHAWADFYHDWVYKKGFRVPHKSQRELAALAATLEQADTTFDRIREDLAIYSRSAGAWLEPAVLEEEIKRLKVNLADQPDNLAVAVQLARRLDETGDWKQAVGALKAHRDSGDAVVLRELGLAFCRLHRENPASRGYRSGQRCLETSLRLDDRDPDTLAALAACLERTDRDRAAGYYQQAYALDPEHPSILAKYLIHSIRRERRLSPVAIMAPAIENAIRRCRDYVQAQVNLPAAYLDMGLLYLLQANIDESLKAYTKAIQLSHAGQPIESALADLDCLAPVGKELAGREWMQRLLLLGLAARFPDERNYRKIKRVATRNAGPLSGPVVIVAGGCDATFEKHMRSYRSLLVSAFRYFDGTLISGGTTAGISGLVGDIQEARGDAVTTLGYVPQHPQGVTVDRRYREIRRTAGEDFTLLEPLQNWTDLLAAGISPAEVKLVGINGGQIASAEYRLGLALGAEVGVIEGSGRDAARLLQDEEWNTVSGLVPMPRDLMTVRSFLRSSIKTLSPNDREQIAQLIHEKYREKQADPDRWEEPSMQVWEKLDPGLQESNRLQADDIREKLREMGFDVREVKDRDIAVMPFTDKEKETLARMEHGRWYVERLRAGWRWGEKKDVANRLNPCLVSWDELPEKEKKKDYEAVSEIPALLASVGMEIVRS